MADITTYRRAAQITLNQHYNGTPMPDSPITLRHIAELWATKVAKYAKISAFQNSNNGDATFASDQFISTFYNLPLLTDATTKDKYVVMPATPAGLPNGQEVAQVSFVGCPSCRVIPCKNKDSFFESLLPTPPFPMYKIEDGNIVFMNLPKLVANAPVNLKLVGAVPGETLLDSVLNVPRDVEDSIRLEVLQELAALYAVKPQTNVNTDAS